MTPDRAYSILNAMAHDLESTPALRLTVAMKERLKALNVALVAISKFNLEPADAEENKLIDA